MRNTMKYNNLKKIAKEKKITIKELAIRAGMTEVGLHQALKNDTLTVHTLESISHILNVSISSLLEEKTTNDVQEPEKGIDWIEKQKLELLEDIAKTLGAVNKDADIDLSLKRIATALEDINNNQE